MLAVVRTDIIHVGLVQPHENRKMKFADLERKQKLIGEGGFGTVFIGYWKHWSGVVAIKEVRLANYSEEREVGHDLFKVL